MTNAFRERGQDGRNELQLQLLDTELTDVVAGLVFLRGRPEVDANRVAIAGHSFGGSLTLLLAARDTAVRATIVFGAAAGSWEGSPGLRARLIAAVGQARAPVFFIYAANDISISPGAALAAEMSRLGKLHRVKTYPPIGHTSAEGHDFYYLGMSMWEPDVFAFLDERMRP